MPEIREFPLVEDNPAGAATLLAAAVALSTDTDFPNCPPYPFRINGRTLQLIALAGEEGP